MIEAIVVGGIDLGETDRLIRLLSPDLGRWAVVARGARASRRRFPGVVDLGTQIRLEARKGRGDLPVVQVAECVTGPIRARDDYDRLLLLAWGAELASALAPEHQPAPKLFGLLQAWLSLLEGDSFPPAARTSFECKALVFGGLGPVLDRCARCGCVLTDAVSFNREAGGAVHLACARGEPVPISELRDLLSDVWAPMRDAKAALSDPWMVAGFAEHHLGRQLRSLSMLRGLRT